MQHMPSFKKSLLASAVMALSMSSVNAWADPDWGHDRGYKKGHYKSYTLQGPCAYLPADRATEFHGNPEDAELRLGMAGNQWVVFDAVMQGFNASRGLDATEPQHHDNKEPADKDGDGLLDTNPDGSLKLYDYWTLDKLRADAANYYIQLIPPGQIRKQIKSGCLVLGNDEERNFLPGSVQVDFDVFASTNYSLMQDLAANGFVTEAVPYIKNKLDIMVAQGNPEGIGTGGAPGTLAHIYDLTMDMLDENLVVSEVDHVNEGVHKAINKMYRSMDLAIRKDGSDAQKQALSAALDDVKDAQPGSPSATRPGTPALYDHANNPDCHYAGNVDTNNDGVMDGVDINEDGTADDLNGDGVVAGDAGTPRFCEFSILNKANTHETRVHHVETPGGILRNVVLNDGDPSNDDQHAAFTPADMGPVWVSELGYQLVRNVPVEGMQPGVFPPPGVEGPAGSGVNAPAVYSIAVLATSENRRLAKQFINYVRSPEGQMKYTDGGFEGLSEEELAGGECYSKDDMGDLVVTPRVGSCD